MSDDVPSRCDTKVKLANIYILQYVQKEDRFWNGYKRKLAIFSNSWIGLHPSYRSAPCMSEQIKSSDL